MPDISTTAIAIVTVASAAAAIGLIIWGSRRRAPSSADAFRIEIIPSASAEALEPEPSPERPDPIALGLAPVEPALVNPDREIEHYNLLTGGPRGLEPDETVEKWEHLAALDERTCLECLLLDGEQVRDTPRRHEGCRCVATPKVRFDARAKAGWKPVDRSKFGRSSQIGPVPRDGGIWKRYLIRRGELLRDRSYGPETGPELLAWIDAQPRQEPHETEAMIVAIRERIRAQFGHGPTRSRWTWELLYEGIEEPAPIYAVRELDPEEEAALAAMPSGFSSPDPMIRERAPDRIAATRFNPERTYTIWVESARLAVHSKNPETASSRYELALDCFRELREAGAPGDLWERVCDTTRHLVAVYPTESLVRASQGAIEKAAKYKTAKKRIETLSAVEARILEGMNSGRCNVARLEPVLQQVRGAMAAE